MKPVALRLGGASVWIVAAVVATISSMVLATLTSGSAQIAFGVDADPELQAFGAEQLSFAPLSPSILDFITGTRSGIGSSNPPTNGLAARRGAESSSTHTTSPPPQQAVSGGGTVLAPTKGVWKLTIAMTSDSKTVAPGGDILYRMIVRNVGGADFGGRNLVLRWHTPLGTLGFFPGRCETVPVDDVKRRCASISIPFPGLGDNVHEETQTGGLVTIKAHEQWVQGWRVRVSPAAQAGTEILNHAHVSVTVSASTQTATSRPVVVTVR